MRGASPAFGQIPSLRDHEPSVSKCQDILRILPGRITRNPPQSTNPGRNQPRTQWHSAISLDNDFYAPHARDYFDRPRDRRPISGIEFPVQPIKATWTNQLRKHEDGEWTRLPRVRTPQNQPVDIDWDRQHHLLKDNASCNPALRDYFNVYPKTIDVVTQPVRARTSEPLAAPMPKKSALPIADISPDEAFLRGKEAACLRRQTDRLLGLADVPDEEAFLPALDDRMETKCPKPSQMERRNAVRRFLPSTQYVRSSFSNPSLLTAPGVNGRVQALHHVAFEPVDERISRIQKSFRERQSPTNV